MKYFWVALLIFAIPAYGDDLKLQIYENLQFYYDRDSNSIVSYNQNSFIIRVDGNDVVKIHPDGRFFIKGKLVCNDKEVYHAFKNFLFPKPNEQNKEIKELLERCREFIQKDKYPLQTNNYGILEYREVLSRTAGIQLEIGELKEKKERIEREDRLRKDIEKMIDRLKVVK